MLIACIHWKTSYSCINQNILQFSFCKCSSYSTVVKVRLNVAASSNNVHDCIFFLAITIKVHEVNVAQNSVAPAVSIRILWTDSLKTLQDLIRQVGFE